MKIDRPILVFPVNTEKPTKKLLFWKENTLVYDLDIRYDQTEPNFYASVDLRRFMGQELTVTIEPETPLVFREEDDTAADDVNEAYRPIYHFTPRNGWMNDPNGLVCDAEGTYHLFYQYNPADTYWANMHWGHATSRDLIHWKRLPIALFPDSLGMMYSGSGLLDRDGVAGFGKNALLLYYTAAGDATLLSKGQPYVQCLAYSTDNGKTFEKYAGNPVIPHIIHQNRDPKIVYCEELQRYIVALYLSGHRYALLATDDLIRFEKIQEIELPDDAECPDFYPLTADDGTRHWVLSGASGRYLIGSIRNGQFVAEQDIRNMQVGSCGYAAQTFSDMPDGRRVCISWDRIAHIPGTSFTSQMGIPFVIALKKREDGYAIYSEPVKEAELLRGSALPVVQKTDEILSEALTPAVELSVALPADGKDVDLSLFGHTFVFDRAKRELRCADAIIPLETDESGKIAVRFFFDTCSVEVFSGQLVTCINAVMDAGLPKIVLTGETGAELTGWNLDRVHF